MTPEEKEELEFMMKISLRVLLMMLYFVGIGLILLYSK